MEKLDLTIVRNNALQVALDVVHWRYRKEQESFNVPSDEIIAEARKFEAYLLGDDAEIGTN